MVGQEVPSLREGGGTVTLRDAADAKEWQEAVKSILIREVQDRASRKADDVKPMMETLHGSIGLFQNNADLVPGTKQFDLDLANRFADLAKPYELRVEEKLVGYTIPVQPLVNQVRSQLAAERAARATTAAPAAPAAAAAPTAQQQRAAEQQRNQVGQFANPDAPQAGIASKAGAGAADEGDFSTLFGTIGLPHLRI